MDTIQRKLKNFMEDFVNFKFSLKFTFECDRTSISCLQLNVRVNNGNLTTSVSINPTNHHQYLHFMSSHRKHFERSIAYSQILRASRLFSFKKDFVD